MEKVIGSRPVALTINFYGPAGRNARAWEGTPKTPEGRADLPASTNLQA